MGPDPGPPGPNRPLVGTEFDAFLGFQLVSHNETWLWNRSSARVLAPAAGAPAPLAENTGMEARPGCSLCSSRVRTKNHLRKRGISKYLFFFVGQDSSVLFHCKLF